MSVNLGTINHLQAFYIHVILFVYVNYTATRSPPYLNAISVCDYSAQK
jgi:hypothetical protein